MGISTGSYINLGRGRLERCGRACWSHILSGGWRRGRVSEKTCLGRMPPPGLSLAAGHLGTSLGRTLQRAVFDSCPPPFAACRPCGELTVAASGRTVDQMRATNPSWGPPILGLPPSPPSSNAVQRLERRLKLLHECDCDGKTTSLGESMTEPQS